jgi:hypothetical protein
MSVHIGNRAKSLVEKYYDGNKKEFAKAIELKNENYLFQLFNKEDLSTDLLKRMASVMKISLSTFVDEEFNVMEDPQAKYSAKNIAAFTEKKELEILRSRVGDMERIIKMQDKELEECRSKLPKGSSSRQPVKKQH